MIVGFTIYKISAERKGIPRGRIDISSIPKLLSVKEAPVKFLGKEKPAEIEFEFVTKYEPDVGEIRIEGKVFYVGKKRKEILKKWKKENKIPKEIEMEIKNFLFRKCLTLGVHLSENMQLPPPLLFPRVVPKKREKLSYIG